jgi:hypothetical protein
MTKNKRPAFTKRARNDLARMKAMGIHAMAEYPHMEQAIVELSRWGLGMKREDLAASAALLTCNGSQWMCTLALRSYFMRLQRLAVGGPNAELSALLASPAPTNELLLLIVNGDETGHSTLSVNEMKEAINGR